MSDYRVVRVRPKCWRIYYKAGLRPVDIDYPCRPLKLVRARCALLNGDCAGSSMMGDHGGAKIKWGKRYAQPR